MTKKAKIIVAASSAFVLLAGIIVSIVLLTSKNFVVTPSDEWQFFNHTEIIDVTPSDTLNISNHSEIYHGTQIVENSDHLHGLYSYKLGRLVVDTLYQDMALVTMNSSNHNSYFRYNLSSSDHAFHIVDQDGRELQGLITCDITLNKTYGTIKQHKFELDKTRHGIEADVSRKTENITIEVSSVSYVQDYSFYKEGEFDYECWKLTSKEGFVYTNIYKVKDNQRELLQTVDNPISNGLENDYEYDVCVLSNGDLRIIKSNKNIMDNLELRSDLYDINLKKIGSYSLNYSEIQNAMATNLTNFRVGNSIFLQYLEKADENDYDFVDNYHVVSSSTDQEYYKCHTYRINLKNGKMSEVDFDYYINNSPDIEDVHTVLVYAIDISNKNIGNYNYIALNDKLQTKVVDLTAEYITKINDDKYLAYYDDYCYLIDDEFNVISTFEDLEFVTQDAIISWAHDDYYYVCDLNGTIVDIRQNLRDVYHGKYFLRREYVTEKNNIGNDVNYEVYYVDSLENKSTTPFYKAEATSSIISEYYYNNQKYDYFGIAFDYHHDSYSFVVRAKESTVAGKYNYEFYNFDNQLLLRVDNVSGITEPVSLGYYIKTYGDDFGLFKFNGKTYKINHGSTNYSYSYIDLTV